MKKKNKRKKLRARLLAIVITGLLTTFTIYGSAQTLTPQAVCTAGGTLSAGSVYLDFTIGQVIDESLSAGNILLTQGFQQGILNFTAIGKTPLNASELSAYPNPVTGRLMLKNNSQETNYEFILSSMQGKILLKQKVTAPLFTVNTGNLNPGLYLLSVYFNDYQPVVYKIIKQ